MSSRNSVNIIGLVLAVFLAFGLNSAQGQALTGTLVVAVPVSDGIVVCTDKRLYNSEARTFTDNSVKIRRAGDNALFAATNTVGFYDPKAHAVAFDAFEVTSRYVSENAFSDSPRFWNGLKQRIADDLRKYLAQRTFAEWPESNKANNDLLFNLVFFSIDGSRRSSHTLRVYYKKARTPVINVSGPIREEVKSPKLSGKGTELVRYFDQNPSAAQDPAIHRFDPSRFDAQQTTSAAAVDFAGRLFRIASMRLPQAHISSTFDCASLSDESGFKWIRQN